MKNLKQNKKALIAVIVIIIFIIAAISVFIYMYIHGTRYAVTHTFSALKNVDATTVNKYSDYNEIVKSVSSESNSNLEKSYFSDLKMKINSITVNGDKATVNIKTTNKNFRNALSKWTSQIYQNLINEKNIPKEEELDLLNQCLTDNSIGTMTVTKDISLSKVNGVWKIEVDDNLIDVLFPGLSEIVNSIEILTNNE